MYVVLRSPHFKHTRSKLLKSEFLLNFKVRIKNDTPMSKYYIIWKNKRLYMCIVLGCRHYLKSQCICNLSIQITNPMIDQCNRLHTFSYHNHLLFYNSHQLSSAIASQNINSVRYISISSISYDKEPLRPSSKVEVTVKELKKKKDEESKIIKTSTDNTKPLVKKSLAVRIWDELVHYYHGFRLLFIDVKVSSGLVWRVLNGKTLTRREHRLLTRTVGDLFRLVPFSVFIIVPFMELLLPVFIKFFPGMLPSTFQTTSEKEDKIKQNLKVKLEMAKFLQGTLDEMSVQHKDRYSDSAKDFLEWFHKVRNSGKYSCIRS